MSQFKRGIRKSGMMKALNELAKRDGWWSDVLKDKSLIIGVRDDYLNVYWCGQSLFKIEMKGGQIVATTHPKYLLDPDLSGQVRLDNGTGTFDTAKFNILMSDYRPGETLAKLKRAARVYAGDEKAGVQAIINANAHVVDVEIAFPALPGERSVPRIDIATFNENGNDIRLEFWEAKLLANPAVRSTGEKNVVAQIRSYDRLLAEHADALVESYRVIAGNLVELAGMSAGARTVAPAIRRVAEGADLRLTDPSRVRLIVYGFDAAQKERIWKPLLKELEKDLGAGNITAIGVAGGIRLAVSYPLYGPEASVA